MEKSKNNELLKCIAIISIYLLAFGSIPFIAEKSKFEKLQIDQSFYLKNKKVMISNQFFHHFKENGHFTNLSEDEEYTFIKAIYKKDRYFAQIKDGENEYEIDLVSLKIPPELFPEKDLFIKVNTEKMNNYFDEEGNKIIDVFITAEKKYPAIEKDSLHILFLDDVGNQVTLNKNLIKKI